MVQAADEIDASHRIQIMQVIAELLPRRKPKNDLTMNEEFGSIYI